MSTYYILLMTDRAVLHPIFLPLILKTISKVTYKNKLHTYLVLK
jgi:hypothetical protein